MKKKTNRRNFLKLAGAAAAAPFLWIPRKSFAAATSGFGQAKHVLLLHTKGGFRSHATFNAVGTAQHNPFGAQAAAVGRQWSLGAACGAQDIVTTTLGTLPSFATISPDVTVIPCVDHSPGGAPDVNHRTAIYRMATGTPDGQTGLLSLVGHDHPMYAGGFSTSAVPPVEIMPSEFGIGAGVYTNTRPLSVLGAGGSFASNKPVGKGWKIAARAAMDKRYEYTRSRAYHARLSNFLVSKANAATFADMLEDPRLNILSQPTATDAGFTNAQLLEVLGNYTIDTLGDLSNMQSWGPDVAMALRFLGFGSPLAVVTRDWYDMHDDEKTNYAPRTTDLVRQYAGLHYLLKNMAHPAGGMYWDHTIVLFMSEFSRNNTMTGGYNSGQGSDHVPQNPGPQRNQAIAMMGGPIAASKGKILGSTDDQINATGTVYSTRSLLSTILDALGIDPSTNWPDAPIAELYA